MKRTIKAIYVLTMICSALVMTSCNKKRYTPPAETPALTKAADEAPYSFDFDQLNNDVIEDLQEKNIYNFVKDLSISGDNDNKEIVLNIDITENVSGDAVLFLLTDTTKAIVDGAHTQDFRIDEYNDDGFGNLFDMYSYSYKVSCGEEIVIEETVKAGESVPFDSSLTIENVMG